MGKKCAKTEKMRKKSGNHTQKMCIFAQMEKTAQKNVQKCAAHFIPPAKTPKNEDFGQFVHTWPKSSFLGVFGGPRARTAGDEGFPLR